MPIATHSSQQKNNKTKTENKKKGQKFLGIKLSTSGLQTRYDASSSRTLGGAVKRRCPGWEPHSSSRVLLHWLLRGFLHQFFCLFCPPPTTNKRESEFTCYFFCSFLPFLSSSLFLMWPRFLFAVFLDVYFCLGTTLRSLWSRDSRLSRCLTL